jgi:hypothetical protein
MCKHPIGTYYVYVYTYLISYLCLCYLIGYVSTYQFINRPNLGILGRFKLRLPFQVGLSGVT